MSILRKIPKIEQVLDNMSIESLKRLESLMNSGNGATETYTLFGGENKLNYVNKDLGVWYCNIELERNKSVETGFLIWESQTKALFISYDITQCLKEYEIDLTNYTYTKINEKLSIEEFRRVLEDNINKEVVHIDTSGNVEVGKNLVVDGKVILNGKQDLVDTSGNELISDGNKLYLDFMPYITQITEMNGTITQEGFDLIETKLNNGEIIGVNMGGTLFNYAYFKYYSVEPSGPLKTRTTFLHNAENEMYFKLTIDGNLTWSMASEPISSDGSGLTFPTTSPSSQVIPSITTSNTQQNLTVGNGLIIENGALDVNRNGVFKTNTITISKSEISLDETKNKQINFNTTAQEKITNLFTLMNQNQNNIVSVKSIIKLSDGSSFIIYMDYHAKSAINNENIQGIAISSAINNSFDLHIVNKTNWQSSADLTNYFSYIQEYEITFCYF